MASSVLCRVGIIISRRIPSLQNSCKCAISCCFCRIGGDDRMMSTSTPPSRTSPWLMFTNSEGGGGGIVYKFYSLAERKYLSITQSESESSLECVGSSHGWIALFDRRNDDLFLSNPLSGRHIKLPPMDPPGKWGPAKVLKLIVSSSPEEEGCRAMMIHGPLNRLAYCSPGDPSSEWTPVGARFPYGVLITRKLIGGNIQVYEDLGYCDTHKRFTTMDAFQQLDLGFNLRTRLSCSGLLTIWDPWDPPVDGHSAHDFHYWEEEEEEKEEPNHTNTYGLLGRIFHYLGKKKPNHTNTNTNTNTNTTVGWVKKNMALLKEQCLQIPHIVHVDGSDQLYIAFQFVMVMNPDDATMPVDRLPDHRFEGWEGRYPSKTVGFVVLKLNGDDEDDEIVDDLDGLAMFVGINNSFALPASDFPELKPDSIYFTDSKRIVSIDGSNDFGIFDYRNKTVFNQFDIFHIDDNMDRRPSSPGTGLVKPSPVWFTPAPAPALLIV